MSRLYIPLYLLFMFFTVAIQAQKKQELALQWTIAAELPVAATGAKALGVAGAIAGVYKNKFIVAGGANFPDAMPWLGGKKKYSNELFVYIKKGKSVSLQQRTNLPFNIAYAASCSTTKGVLVAGGENENGISDKVFLLQLVVNSLQLVIQNLPDLPIAITNASITSIGNKIYIAGGETVTGVSHQFLVIDLKKISDGWRQLSAIPKQVSHAVLLTKDDRIYLIGGRKKNSNGISDLYNSVFVFDLLTNQWTEKKSLPYALSAGTGAVYKNQIVLFGGDKGETFHRTEELIAAVNVATDEITEKKLTDAKTALQSSHPGFSKEVLAYNINTNEWNKVGSIPYDTPVTTIAVTWNNCFFIPSGEIKAGVRSPYILSVKPQFQK
jgi:N-acetylneuraminate epimerase